MQKGSEEVYHLEVRNLEPVMGLGLHQFNHQKSKEDKRKLNMGPIFNYLRKLLNCQLRSSEWRTGWAHPLHQ